MKHLKTFEQHSFDDVNEEIRYKDVKKFLTGHESRGAKDKTVLDFQKALDEAEERVNKNPNKYVFNRERLEKQAKENNYKGGLRIQRGGRDKSRFYVVYDKGASGFEDLASAAGGYRREKLGM